MICEGCFTRGKFQGAYLWETAPSDNKIDLELMIRFKLNSSHEFHVMIVPWLITYLWRKHLGKEKELMISITVELYFWKLEHQKIMILICLLPVLNIINWSDP